MLRLAAVAAGLSVLIAGLTVARNEVNPASRFMTAPVERSPISKVIKATGTVEAVLTVDVSSQLSGRIADVLVSFNDAVSAGQPIARLDQDIFNARLTEATAGLNVARASAEVARAGVDRATFAESSARTAQKVAEAQNEAAKARQAEAELELQRKITLSNTGIASERELSQAQATRDEAAAEVRAAIEQIHMKEEAIAAAGAELQMATAGLHNAEATVEQRQAAVDQAKLDLEHTVLRAPIDGVILKRDVNPGQTLAVALEAKTLFEIANDLRQMEVHARIDEADVGELRQGQKATFTVDAYPDRSFSGEIRQIRKSPETAQNVVTYTAVISAPNPELLLFPGMTAVLQIIVGDGATALRIPNAALRFRPDAVGLSKLRVQSLPTASLGTSTVVWTPDEDRGLVPVPVRIGLSDDRGAQLLEGSLTEGQPLIVAVANSDGELSVLDIRTGF